MANFNLLDVWNPLEFDAEDKALNFLRQFGFDKIQERSDYTVWETRAKPKVRANLYLDKHGNWIVARQEREIE